MPSGIGNALQGAAGGAAAGSILGPVGAVAGGVLGGALGYFGSDGESDEQKQYREQLAALGQYQAPNLGQMQYANTGQYGGAIDQSLAMQLAAAQGNGPSAAMAAARMQQDRNAQNQLAMAAGAVNRGVSAGAAYRNASNVNAAGDMATQQQLIQARAQEQLNAMSLYGQQGLTAQGQSQDLNMFNSRQANDFAVQRARMEQDERNRQMQALQAAAGINSKTGPSTGEQIMAGGAAARSMVPMGGQDPQQNSGQYINPANRPYAPGWGPK